MRASHMSVRLADAETARLLGGVAGALISLALTPSDVAVAEEIDTYLAGFAPFEFRADEASPIVLVDRDTDKFRNFSNANAFKMVNVEVSRQGALGEVDPETELSKYTVIERALGAFVPAVTEANATKLFEPRAAAARRIKWALDLDRESRVWTLLTTSGSWATANKTTLGGTANWNGGSTSDPILDIQTRIEASAQIVTDIWMNPQVAHAFLRHDKVRDHMRQMLGDAAPAPGAVGASGAVSRVDFQIPGLPPIHVVPAKKLNESTSALDYILNDSCILTSRPPGGMPTSGQEIATSHTFRRRGPSGVGFTSREYFVDERGLDGGRMLVAGHAEDVKMIASTVGGAIFDIIQ